MSSQASAPVLSGATLAAALGPRRDGLLHLQLEQGLRELIRSGQVRPGSVIPGELDLAAHLHLSRHTVRHALGVLTAEGLLRRQRGRGTTVVSDGTPVIFERSLSDFYAFAWEVRARGAEQRSFVLERATLAADRALAERLEVAPGEPVERLVRLRTADDEPLVLETSHLPARLARGIDTAILEREAIYDAIERLHDVRIVRAHETLRPVVLQRAVARLLGVATGSPAFSVERTTWSAEAPIEWQVSLVRGDRYLYSVDLPRRGGRS
jgi:GntR family transcriptional regulator, N-acetylglucosamine utilization regulator